MKKKWCSILLSLAMIGAVLSPLSAWAADDKATLTDTVVTRVTPNDATGLSVYAIDYNMLTGVARYTLQENVADWNGSWWQTRMYLQVSGNDFAGADGVTFTVTASSEAVAEYAAKLFAVGFQSALGEEDFTLIHASSNPSIVTTVGDSTYQYRIPFAEMSGSSPEGYSSCYMMISFNAQRLHDLGENTTDSYFEFSQFGAYRNVETALEMDAADIASVSVKANNGGTVSAAITDDALSDSRSYAGLLNASLQMHKSSTLTLTAEKVHGRTFEGWQRDGVTVSKSETLTVTGVTDGVVYTAVYGDMETKTPDGVDIFWGSAWTAAEAGATLQLNLDEETLINRVDINESTTGSVQTFHLEIWNGESWENVYDNDYIAHGRICILPEDVTTDSVRLVIDTISGSATITGFSATYQGSTNDSNFMHVGYASNQWYDRQWVNFRSTDEQLSMMTDIIMLGSFVFDNDGNFLLYSLTENVTYDPFSEEADAHMREWLDRLKDASTNLREGKTHLWLSLTARNATTSTAFNTKETRETFTEQVCDFAEKYGFYGVDVDWEYPTTTGSLTAFRSMLASLTESTHARGMKVSSTLCPSYITYLGQAEFEELDYVSFMTYTNVVNNAKVQGQVPLYQLEEWVDNCLNRGLDPAKLWIGLPYFGKPAGQPAQTFLSLYVTYMLDHEGEDFPKGLNRITQGSYSYLYNGAYLLQDKVAYTVEKGCAGIMTWWTGQDITVFGEGETIELQGITAKGEDSLALTLHEAVRRFTGLNPIRTDYTEMEQVLAQVPEDLSGYTSQSVQALQEAIDAIDFNLNVTKAEQAKYNEMLANLKEALKNLQLKSTDGLRGDVDLNGKVDATDALAVLRIVVGLDDYTDEQLNVGDLDYDGAFSAVDALMILRIVVGLDTDH